MHVLNQLCLARLCCSPTDSFANLDRLAGNLAMKRSQDETSCISLIKDIEASPVHGRGWLRQRLEAVPEQRSRVSEIGDPIALISKERAGFLQNLSVDLLFRRARGEVGRISVHLMLSALMLDIHRREQPYHCEKSGIEETSTLLQDECLQG